MRTAIPLTVLATALACSHFASPAQARARVFVASYGSDSNPCTFLSPCRNFQQAVTVVDPGGEVTAIDSAGFGPINITQSVTITSPAGVEAGIAGAANTSAITIVAPGASVALRGLTLQGPGGMSNSSGIYVNAASHVEIVDCVVRDFGVGIEFDSGAAMNFLISNTIVSDNYGPGIYISNDGSTSPINGVIDHVVATNNNDGIAIVGGVNNPTYYTISNTISSNNIRNGLNIQADGSARFVVNIDLSYFNNNGGNGIENALQVIGATSVVLLGRSVVSGNVGYGITYNNGTFASYGDKITYRIFRTFRIDGFF